MKRMMIDRIIRSLFIGLTVCLAMLWGAAMADDASDFTIVDGVLTEYNGRGGVVTIPEGVTAIGNQAFVYSAVTSVELPEGLTSIGYRAFESCFDLKEINFPEGLQSIGNNAFVGCTSLTSLDFPESLQSIGGNAFWGCTGLTQVVLPKNITELESYTFYECTNLTSVIFPENFMKIGSGAFFGCEDLTNIVFPKNLQVIGGSAFYGCSSLTSVALPESVTKIESYAFERCTNIKDVRFSKEITDFGGGVFTDCTSLTEITIPANQKISGNYTFSGCTSLSSVTIQSGVTISGRYTFSGCTSLSSVTIQTGVTISGSYTFSGCTNLSSVSMKDSLNINGDSTFAGCDNLTSVIIPPNTKIGGTRTFYNCDGLTNVTMLEGLLSIGDYTFADCENLTYVELPKGLISIGKQAFDECINLKSIVLPEELRSIGNWAFSQCQNLLDIDFPKNLTYIGDGAFSECNGLTRVVLHESLTNLGCAAFYYCDGLTSVVLSDGLTSIGDSTFFSCPGLKKISLPEQLTSIGKNAFHGCVSLQDVDLPQGLTSIGESAFKHCQSLTSIKIPEEVTSINADTFSSCYELTSVELPKGVMSIGDRAFSSCQELESINFSDGLISIGDSAFYRCLGLTDVELPEGLLTIGKEAFDTCAYLRSINIPSSVETIGAGAFRKCNNLTTVYAVDLASWMAIDFADAESNPLNTEDAYGIYRINHLYFDAELVTKVVVPDGVTFIPPYVFYDCDSLEELILPESVTTIGSGAFRACYNLASVILPDGITSIAKDSFCGLRTTAIRCNEGSSTELTLKNAEIPYLLIGSSTYTYIQNGNGTVTITGYTGTEARIEVPDKLEGFSVTAIDDEVFYGVYASTIILPEGVTAIGQRAFAESSLRSISFPSTLRTIGMGAFDECYYLKNVYAPDAASWLNISFHYSWSDTNSPMHYAENLYFGGQLVTDLVIPEGTTAIGEAAFYNCNTITSVTIPDSLETVGPDAFWKCDSLKDVYAKDLESWLKIVFDDAIMLEGCNLHLDGVLVEELVVPEGTTAIGDFCFYGCGSLTSVTLPEGLTDIGPCAFGYSGLESIHFPSSLEEIDDWAFAYCENLTSIVLPKNVQTIGYSAFCGSGLKSINFPASITSVEACAFDECSIEAIYAADVASWVSIDFEGELASPLAIAAADLYFDNQLAVDIVIPAGVSEIKDYAFMGCSSLKSVKISEGVERIGDGAFWDSTLTSVKFPSTLTSIGDLAFWQCELEKSVYLPDNISSIGGAAFGWWGNTDEEAFPTLYCNWETPTENALYEAGYEYEAYETYFIWTKVDRDNCTINDYTGGELEVVIPAKLDGVPVTELDDYLMYNNPQITSITIPETLQRVTQSYVCKEEDQLSAVYVKSLEHWLSIDFASSCSNVILNYAEKLYIDDELLMELEIPEDIQKVGACAFANYQLLTSVSLPEGVTEIGDYAFYGCNNLTTITLPESIASIGEKALWSMGNLMAKVIKGSYAHQWCVDNGIECEAAEAEDDGVFTYYTNEDGTITIHGYTGSKTDLVFPAVIDGYQVTAIRDWQGMENITSAVISEGIQTIRTNTFRNCAKLTSVSLPSTLKTIEWSAFYGTGLTSLTLPEGVETIQNRAFGNISTLSAVELPASLKTLQGGAFVGTPLTSLTVDSSSTTFKAENNVVFSVDGTVLVAYPSTLTGTYTIPEGVTTIGHTAFTGSKLTKLNLPSTLTDIRYGAFMDCALTELVLPAGIRTLHESALESMTSLVKLTLNKGLEVIGPYSLYYCPKLESVEIPSTVTTIDDGAFGECYALKEVIIPAGVTAIGDDVFDMCDAVVVKTTTGSYAQKWCEDNGVEVELLQTATIAPIPAGQIVLEPIPYGMTAKSMIADGAIHVVFDDEATNWDEVYTFNPPIQWYDAETETITPEFVISFGAAFTPPEEAVAYRSLVNTGADLGDELVLSLLEKETLRTMPMWTPGWSWDIASYDGETAKYTLEELKDDRGDIVYVIQWLDADSNVISTQKAVFCFEYKNPEKTYSASRVLIPAQSIAANAGDAFGVTSEVDDGSVAYTQDTLDTVIETLVTAPENAAAYSMPGEYFDSTARRYPLNDRTVSYAREGTLQDSARVSEFLCWYDTDGKLIGGGWIDFNYVLKLPKVVLPADTKEIHSDAFRSSGVQHVVIPDGCTAIGEFAFADCASLIRIDIPSSVTLIAENAFDGCESLTIYAPMPSTAADYASTKGIRWINSADAE